MNVLSSVVRAVFRRAPTLVITMLGVFLLLKLAPGDAIDALVAESGGGDPVSTAALRVAYGLDQPLYVQTIQFLKRLVNFDFGQSVVHSRDVAGLLLERAPLTVTLMLVSVLCAFIIGSALGLVAAKFHNKPVDLALSTAAVLAYAMPAFWLALLLIIVFSVRLRWFPAAGFETVGSDLEGWGRVADVLRHMFLPVFTLSTTYVAIYFRQMRSSALEVKFMEFIKTARAKGLSESRVQLRHLLPNAILPVLTVLGLQVGGMLGGSVVVESVFAIPGLGRLAFESVVQRDINVLLAIVFLSSLLVVSINILVDIVQGAVDPRVGG